jgi:hypothetical protein
MRLEKPQEIKFVPINNMRDAAALAEQLNGLLGNYHTILLAYKQTMYIASEEINKNVFSVLEKIEKAIDAVCFRLSHEVITVE